MWRNDKMHIDQMFLQTLKWPMWEMTRSFWIQIVTWGCFFVVAYWPSIYYHLRYHGFLSLFMPFDTCYAPWRPLAFNSLGACMSDMTWNEYGYGIYLLRCTKIFAYLQLTKMCIALFSQGSNLRYWWLYLPEGWTDMIDLIRTLYWASVCIEA